MKVYVVEKGCYEDRFVEGIYATPELAMAANPIPDEINSRYRIPNREPGWKMSGDGCWTNNLDWGEAGDIWETTVVGAVESGQEQKP